MDRRRARFALLCFFSFFLFPSLLAPSRICICARYTQMEGGRAFMPAGLDRPIRSPPRGINTEERMTYLMRMISVAKSPHGFHGCESVCLLAFAPSGRVNTAAHTDLPLLGGQRMQVECGQEGCFLGSLELSIRSATDGRTNGRTVSFSLPR